MISEAIIEQAFDQIDGMDEDQLNRLSTRFMDEQPYLAAFLLSFLTESVSEEAEQTLFFAGIIIWYAGLLYQDKVKTVASQTIDQAEEQNSGLIQRIMASEDMDTFEDQLQVIFEGYPEPELLNLSLSLFAEEDDQGEEVFSLQEQMMLFIAAKIYTDALAPALA